MVRSLVMLCLLAGMTAAMAASSSITLQYRNIMGFPVKFVTINMNDPEVVVTPALAPGFPTGLESWGSFLNRLKPDAAINGTYFCVNSYMPVGDIAVDGGWFYKGSVGTALCITPDNQVIMRPGPRQARPDWVGYRMVMCAGPRLLTDGDVQLNPKAEGFRDPHVLGSATRSAVALRPDNTLIFLTIEAPISLRNLAWVCQHLGATQAMALDGGNSSGLYADGRTVTRPGRSISNIIAVYSSRERFSRAASHLVPSRATLLQALLPKTPYLRPLTPTPPAVLPPVTYAVTPPPAAPAPVPAKPQPLLRIVRPAKSDPVRGLVPIVVEVSPESPVRCTFLRINGRLHAISNIWPLQYNWDSTKETDGTHTIEVTAWSQEQGLLGRDTLQLEVCNNPQVAGVK